jgi:hypothetical protein
MRKPRSITEKPALDLIEETVALLRRCPVPVLALYYVGTIPFVLGFLYFWTDMSRGAFAQDHLAEGSLVVAVEFLWCKVWQSLFAVHLLAVAGRRALPPWTWRRLLRLAAGQATLQATGLFILPVAALVTVPIAFAYAFYQNVAVLALDGEGEPLDGAALRREAAAQSRRWPAQNHVGLMVLSFFALVVFANWMIVILSLPQLLKILLGIETMFTRSLWSVFNTTLFGAAAAITYLCVDPFFKAFYTLRCFHGRSLATGEDLRIALRVAPLIRAAAAIALLCCAGMARGAEPSGAVPAKAAEIDQSITEVLNRPEFAWRSPREEAKPGQDGATFNFMRGIARMLHRWARAIKHWTHPFFHWLGQRLFHRAQEEDNSGGGPDFGPSLKVFAWVFCGLAACALGIIGWKIWLRRAPAVHIDAAPQTSLPDLTAEDVAADQLPGDAWLGLAREMIERGDLRLALRAFYLAALAHLSERQFISIARYKSNRDYQRELRRRRPAETELNATFEETVGSFERAWYGMHEVTWEILTASQSNLERIRRC